MYIKYRGEHVNCAAHIAAAFALTHKVTFQVLSSLQTGDPEAVRWRCYNTAPAPVIHLAIDA